MIDIRPFLETSHWGGWGHNPTPIVVYRCFAADGDLLYVGCTAQLYNRLYNHRYSSPWSADVDRVETRSYPNRRAAMEAERQAILFEVPRYNRDHNPGFDVERAAQ